MIALNMRKDLGFDYSGARKATAFKYMRVRQGKVIAFVCAVFRATHGAIENASWAIMSGLVVQVADVN